MIRISVVLGICLAVLIASGIRAQDGPVTVKVTVEVGAVRPDQKNWDVTDLAMPLGLFWWSPDPTPELVLGLVRHDGSFTLFGDEKEKGSGWDRSPCSGSYACTVEVELASKDLFALFVLDDDPFMPDLVDAVIIVSPDWRSSDTLLRELRDHLERVLTHQAPTWWGPEKRRREDILKINRLRREFDECVVPCELERSTITLELVVR